MNITAALEAAAQAITDQIVAEYEADNGPDENCPTPVWTGRTKFEEHSTWFAFVDYVDGGDLWFDGSKGPEGYLNTL